MNYNLHVTIERVNGKFLTQTEVAGIGRAKRDRFSTDTLPEALDKISAFHTATVAELEVYHAPATPERAAAKAPAPADGSAVAPPPAGAKAPKAPKVARRTKEPKRQFALAK